jgi:hypothetical protein
MKILFSLLSIFFFMFPSGDPQSQVKVALDEQVRAWNSGELEKAMAYYWNSTDMLWINRAGVSKGYQPVLEDYLKSYTDRSQMGTYSYTPLHIQTLSPELVYFVFKWKIEVKDKKPMGGVSSQIWKKINKSWVVVSEHAS